MTGPDKIMIIRHAEEHHQPGVTEDCEGDDHSLTVRGWQRAGALTRLFGPDADPSSRPNVVYASAIGPGSETKRPQQTVAPLIDLMKSRGDTRDQHGFMKTEVEALMADVSKQSGVVLIAWEHSRIPACVSALSHPPGVPCEWPGDRYDLVWVFNRSRKGWVFRQVAQLLLAGDSLAV